MSKRKLLRLVNEKHVSGWDDPRMPTIAGLRRRGYTPEAIRAFCERIGVAKKRENTIELATLEHFVREDLNKRAPRAMAVLRPLKVVLTNYPEGQVEELDAVNNPEDPSAGTRKVPFSRELYIERDDFREDPPKKFFRLAPGREVRLRYAYFITCTDGREGRGRRDRRGALHLRSGDARRRLAGRPEGEGDDPLGLGAARRSTPRCGCTTGCSRLKIPKTRRRRGLPRNLNPASLEVVKGASWSRRRVAPGRRFQFERLGYFCVDAIPGPARSCSTARSRCATPGRESNRSNGVAEPRRLE